MSVTKATRNRAVSAYAGYYPTPRDQLPLAMSQTLDKIVGAPSSFRKVNVYTGPQLNVDYDKELPQVPAILPVTSNTRSTHHSHIRSQSLSYDYNASHDTQARPSLDHRLKGASKCADVPLATDTASITAVVDEDIFDAEDGVGSSPEERYDSEDNTQSSNTQSSYVSSLPHDPPSPYSSWVRTRARARTLTSSRVPCDGVGQARTGQHRAGHAHMDEEPHEESISPLQETGASPVIVSASPSEDMSMVVPRPPRPITRFAPVDPTRRHATYYSLEVWPAGASLLSSGSEVSESLV